jgi:hypothetical protein
MWLDWWQPAGILFEKHGFREIVWLQETDWLNGDIKENPSVFSVEMVLKAKKICFSNVASVQEFGGKVWIDVMFLILQMIGMSW